MVYGNLSSIAIDPVEKKPLYHFLPGTDIFSVGTFGCNLNCRHCQNFSISRALPPEKYRETTPEQLIRSAIASGCSSIAYTYNEPIIFYEYVIDSSKLAKNKGIKNVIVSNGFVNEKPLRDLCKFIDGANIDLKAFNDEFYREVTFSRLQPVLDALKILHEEKVWLEITNLVIPGLNDDMKEIKQMCEWIKGNIGTEHPLHFTAFYPCYKLKDKQATSPATLKRAREIALKTGLKYVYVGNIAADEQNNTYCPECKSLLIERGYMNVIKNKIKKESCFNCGARIAGVWNR